MYCEHSLLERVKREHFVLHSEYYTVNIVQWKHSCPEGPAGFSLLLEIIFSCRPKGIVIFPAFWLWLELEFVQRNLFL